MDALSAGFEPDAACFSGDQVDPIDLEEEARRGQETLKRVEQQFIDYFLKSIGPSGQTERVRKSVLSTLNEILST